MKLPYLSGGSVRGRNAHTRNARAGAGIRALNGCPDVLNRCRKTSYKNCLECCEERLHTCAEDPKCKFANGVCP
jgi:hypothetical protein